MQYRQRPYLPKCWHMKAIIDDDFFEQSVAHRGIYENLLGAFLQKHIQLMAMLRIHKVAVDGLQMNKLPFLQVEKGVAGAVGVSWKEAQEFCKPDDKSQMKISNLIRGFVECQ